ncbi:MAG: hypothetical protein LCI02_04855 [Proteobacteria bacterium]|nr:hypothetical protein [Pseudomonadota bacterium]
MTTEYYYYGQGKVWSRRLNVGGGKWRWWGDVSSLTIAMEIEKLEHKESYSGNKGIARSFPTSKALKLTATVHQLDTDSLAETVYGATSAIAAGAVVGEDLGTVAVGDVLKLDYAGVSALVITDSTVPTAATIAAGNYVLDERFGSLEFTGLPSSPAPTMPLKAAYSHLAAKQVNFLTQAQPIVEFRYEGINLAESNAPQIVEIYRMGTDPLQELALINNDTNLSGAQITMAALIDSTKSATGALGQFGRILQLAAV